MSSAAKGKRTRGFLRGTCVRMCTMSHMSGFRKVLFKLSTVVRHSHEVPRSNRDVCGLRREAHRELKSVKIGRVRYACSLPVQGFPIAHELRFSLCAPMGSFGGLKMQLAVGFWPVLLGLCLRLCLCVCMCVCVLVFAFLFVLVLLLVSLLACFFLFVCVVVSVCFCVVVFTRAYVHTCTRAHVQTLRCCPRCPVNFCMALCAALELLIPRVVAPSTLPAAEASAVYGCARDAACSGSAATGPSGRASQPSTSDSECDAFWRGTD